MKHVRIYFRHPCAGMLVCFLESGAAPRASLQFPEINITAIPFFSTSVLVCFLVLGAAPKASAQIPEVNITAITDRFNEFSPPPPAPPAPLLQPRVLVCFLVLGAAPKASAQIPEVNITAITDFLNEFFAALHKDVQSSFPGTKLSQCIEPLPPNACCSKCSCHRFINALLRASFPPSPTRATHTTTSNAFLFLAALPYHPPFSRAVSILASTCSRARRRTRATTTMCMNFEKPQKISFSFLSRVPSVPLSDVLKGKAENTGDYNDVDDDDDSDHEGKLEITKYT
ncbi:unnamed protein product [Closterium sp. Yama58-4]|nr:unnamed protein product [Closterium sp. Yama58-4]